MKQKNRIFSYSNLSRGTVLIEFLLTIALAGALIPFVYSYQTRAVARVENLRVTRQMQMIQTALENYIVQNREQMLKALGPRIMRIKLTDLIDYGIDANFAKDMLDKYQLRILKSGDVGGKSTLQGVIVFNDADLTAMRTREIVKMGDDKIGFIEGHRAYGGFGTWRADTVDMGLGNTSGIIQTTGITRDDAMYLWRVPSDNDSDATMASVLNLGNRDINNVTFINADGISIEESLDIDNLKTSDAIFKNRTTIDSKYNTQTALVSGTLSGDSKNISINGMLSLADYAKVSSFTTNNLSVNTLTLSGFSVPSDSLATIRIGGALDMTEGRISAMFVTVGFTGSITPRLGVKEKIVDSVNPNYYWNVNSGVASLGDINSPVLSDMATKILRRESVSGSTVTNIFNTVVSNKNATVGDFMKAINEIQQVVRGKYQMLNLE
ncbi:MAG: hypothetical protein J6Y07_01025 [Alphaproteobacteria bacterium]|nr:hypothetical protein [Alphaproteobacteria bacterium]